MVTGNPHVTGYGIDLSPEGVSAGQKELERHNLQDRVHLLVGDMFNIDQVKDQLGPIDFATCIYVLHEMMTESRDTALELLRKFRSSFPGVRLAVCEVIRHSPDELRRKPGGVMDIQLFHALSNQLLFSQQEWRDVFREAGFTQIDEEYLAYARTAIFVVS
jgi:ubiquinone/menaquinone biosynthesis C-methylase UbiE